MKTLIHKTSRLFFRADGSGVTNDLTKAIHVADKTVLDQLLKTQTDFEGIAVSEAKRLSKPPVI